MIEKILPKLIEGGLLALEDSSRQDPRNLLYPDEWTSHFYEHLNSLIARAKKENIDISRIRAGYANDFTKYGIAI